MRLPVLMVVTALPLVAAWYELSGGADFEPGEVGVAPFAPRDRPAAVETEQDGAPSGAVPTALAGTGAASPGDATGAAPASVRTARAADLPQITATDPAGGRTADPQTADAPELGERRVAESRTVLREGPGLRFDRVTELLQGERVAVLSEDPRGWVELRAAGDVTGWVQADALLPDG